MDSPKKSITNFGIVIGLYNLDGVKSSLKICCKGVAHGNDPSPNIEIVLF